MSDPGDLTRQEDVVPRLRELHAAADDEDRSRAALYLGLAIADLVPRLPDGDPRKGELAAEGLSRLDDSADASSAAAQARKLLPRYLPAKQGPESFSFAGGDLTWDLDWDALRGPAETARKMTATLPLIASMLPPQAPLRQALTDIADVIGAFDRGQWSAEQDAMLASAIRQVEADGLGTGLGLTLRMVAMMVRVHRCRLTEQEGGQPDWPSLAELDALIGDMESADDLAMSFDGPFQVLAGMHHLYIAGVIMMRFLVDIRRRDMQRDRAWRDNMLRLLDQANDHLRLTPPAYAGPVQQMRGNLARVFAALSQATFPPAASSASSTGSAPWSAPTPSSRTAPSSAPSAPTPEKTHLHQAPEHQQAPDKTGPPLPDPVATALAGLVGQPGTPSWSLEGPLGRIASPEALRSFQALAELSGGPVMTSMSRMMSVLESIFARRWTPEADQGLAVLRQEAKRLNDQQGSSLADRAVVAAMLAMARVGEWHLKSASPRPAERPSASDVTDLIAEVEAALEVLSAAAIQFPSVATFAELQGPLHAEAAMLLTDLGRPGGDRPDAGLIARARAHMASVPTEMFDQMPPVVRDIFLLQGIVADGRRPESAEAERLAERFGEVAETSGGDLTSADAALAKARQSQDPAAIEAAISELGKAGIALPSGSPLQARRLISLAEMQTLLAMHTSYPLALGDAIGSAIEAVRAASVPADKKSAAQRLIAIFSLMMAKGQREGPFEQAEELLRGALADADANDWPLSVVVTVGMGAAVGMRAAASDDQDLAHVAVQLVGNAERLLPETVPTGDWYGAARTLYTWTVTWALYGAGSEVVPVALRLTDRLEAVLVSNPEMAERVFGGDDGDASAKDEAVSKERETLRQGRAQLLAATGQPPGTPSADGTPVRPKPTPEDNDGGLPRPPLAPEEAHELARRGLDKSSAALGRTGPDGPLRRPLAAVGRPEPAPLRDAMTDLHAALVGIFGDIDLRCQIDAALGLCAAELYWADPSGRTVQTLQDAVVHLNRALTSSEHALPTIGRADLLEVLARCWHEVAVRPDQKEQLAQARTEAGRAARAAVRELARCVLLTQDTGEALEVAARANEVVSRSVGWCLTDCQDRAAVEMAEAGRGLVLASIVLAGRVEEVLRGAERHEVADAWRQGSEAGRIAALNALWDTSVSTTLLATPTADQVSVMLAATNFDAVVYLMPPAPTGYGCWGDAASSADQLGHAVLMRPLLSKIEVLPLPRLAAEGSEPLDAYLAALDDALTSFDPSAGNAEGFRGGAQGQAWADALVKVGYWAYDRIVGPLIEHIRGWNLDHRPHLALIPLGDLAAIPYAAAWTEDTASANSHRYAIDDVLLTYAASARLLGEVSRRPRQLLTERVVLVSAPTGEFPMTRRAARLLARHQYPGAEVYGLKNAPNGPATTDVLLHALPAQDRPGASLFQLCTHATTEPTPRLQSRDGWLPLSGILEQARNRPPDAPGGLIVTNACLTDSTRTKHDESLTLATALLAAGATAVIGTRWPVDDDTTAALSLRLHYHLQLGKLPAEALRYAQLDLLRLEPDIRESLGLDFAGIEESRLSHPASWAGYVHHGI